VFDKDPIFNFVSSDANVNEDIQYICKMQSVKGGNNVTNACFQ